MLSAITRQAALLKMKIENSNDTSDIVDNIITNSNQLYASSRHFIWNLNNDSDDPEVLFQYLTSFGQGFYNQFDMSFSAENNVTAPDFSVRLEPFAAINLIFIFKELMNNVVKHAGAKEVILEMFYKNSFLFFKLTDDGKWKEPDLKVDHDGLSNLKKRCSSNNFEFTVNHDKNSRTCVEIAVPVILKQPAEALVYE